jgi:hypothetical protein
MRHHTGLPFSRATELCGAGAVERHTLLGPGDLRCSTDLLGRPALAIAQREHGGPATGAGPGPPCPRPLSSRPRGAAPPRQAASAEDRPPSVSAKPDARGQEAVGVDRRTRPVAAGARRAGGPAPSLPTARGDRDTGRRPGPRPRQPVGRDTRQHSTGDRPTGALCAGLPPPGRGRQGDGARWLAAAASAGPRARRGRGPGAARPERPDRRSRGVAAGASRPENPARRRALAPGWIPSRPTAPRWRSCCSTSCPTHGTRCLRADGSRFEPRSPPTRASPELRTAGGPRVRLTVSDT